MHERTHRRILIAAFVLLCVIPTAAILISAAVWNSSLPAQWISHQLSVQFGMDVQLIRCESPRLNQYRLIGTVVADPETGVERLHIPEMIATKRRAGWQLQIPSLVVKLQDIPIVWRTFHDRQIRMELQQARPLVSISCDKLRVDCPNATSLSLHKLAWIRGSDPELWHESRFSYYTQPVAQLRDHRQNADTDSMSAAATGQSKPVTVAVRRNRQMGPAYTEIEFDPAGHSVPIKLLAACLEKDYVGEAVFEAAEPVRVTFDEGRFSARVKGFVNNLDLAQLTPKWLPPETTGTADLRFTLYISQHGLEPNSALGVVAERVRISRRAVERLIQDGIVVAGPALPNRQQETIEADRVGLVMSIRSDDTIVCQGGLSDAVGAVLALSARGPLLITDRKFRLDDAVHRMAYDVRQSTEHVSKLRRLLSL